MTRIGLVLVGVGIALVLLGVLTWPDPGWDAYVTDDTLAADEGGSYIYDPGSPADALVPAGGGFWAGAGWTSTLIGAGLLVAGRRRT